MTAQPTPTRPRLLIAGIGNIFLGDDAFGVEVVRRLAECSLPQSVTVADFGIRGIDLTYALLDDGYDAVLLVDTAPRGGQPGTLYVIEPDPVQTPSPDTDASQALPSDPGDVMIDTHNMDPAKVLRLATALGGSLQQVLLLGCEPSPPAASYEEMAGGLSKPVQAAVDEAVSMTPSLALRMLGQCQDTMPTDHAHASAPIAAEAWTL